jgi:hypothetical protein
MALCDHTVLSQLTAQLVFVLRRRRLHLMNRYLWCGSRITTDLDLPLSAFRTRKQLTRLLRLLLPPDGVAQRCGLITPDMSTLACDFRHVRTRLVC